jgi:hypothetical protein
VVGKRGDKPFLKLVTDSSLVCVNAGNKPVLKHMDFNGKERFKTSLRHRDRVKNVYFNQLRNTYTVVQQAGFNEELKEGSYRFTQYNHRGKLTDDLKVTLPGEFLNVLTSDTTIWVFSNTNTDNGTTITASILDRSTGETDSTLVYSFSQVMDSPALIKNDNESLTILGNQAEARERVVYGLIDFKGNIRYERLL